MLQVLKFYEINIYTYIFFLFRSIESSNKCNKKNSLLLHELVTVSSKPGSIRARTDRSLSMHSHHLRFRQDRWVGPNATLRMERPERWMVARHVRSYNGLEKKESRIENFIGCRRFVSVFFLSLHLSLSLSLSFN